MLFDSSIPQIYAELKKGNTYRREILTLLCWNVRRTTMWNRAWRAALCSDIVDALDNRLVTWHFDAHFRGWSWWYLSCSSDHPRRSECCRRSCQATWTGEMLPCPHQTLSLKCGRVDKMDTQMDRVHMASDHNTRHIRTIHALLGINHVRGFYRLSTMRLSTITQSLIIVPSSVHVEPLSRSSPSP